MVRHGLRSFPQWPIGQGFEKDFFLPRFILSNGFLHYSNWHCNAKFPHPRPVLKFFYFFVFHALMWHYDQAMLLIFINCGHVKTFETFLWIRPMSTNLTGPWLKPTHYLGVESQVRKSSRLNAQIARPIHFKTYNQIATNGSSIEDGRCNKTTTEKTRVTPFRSWKIFIKRSKFFPDHCAGMTFKYWKHLA